MILKIFRRSRLPVELESVEVEALNNLPIMEVIEYEKNLRNSGRATEVIQVIKGLVELAEILDQVSRYSSIQSRMSGDAMIVEILDQRV